MLEVIAGCMYSGKTSELLRRTRLSEIAGLRCLSFKHGSDQRYSQEHIVTHPSPLGNPGNSSQYGVCTPVPNSQELVKALESSLASGVDFIAIDEVQFFDKDAAPAIVEAANRIHVVVAGLTLDARGTPFSLMPDLLANADEIHLLHAVCTNKAEPGGREGERKLCGRKATRTLDLRGEASRGSNLPLVAVGSYERYAARCRDCWVRARTKH